MSWTPLIGHESVLAQLRRALERGRLGHAFLFAGPAGIGKKRVARHVGQGLLCETRPAAALDPCDRCSGCRQVVALTHPDYFELARPKDKNVLPIEMIQELTAHLALKPARGGRKIAVIDDADLFNAESANAFLKTLEEPPPRSVLILLATSADTQLKTIVSRCQMVRFSKLDTDQVALVLRNLGTALDDAHLGRLAEWGSGSVGRALSLADAEWSQARTTLVDGLCAVPIDSMALAAEMQAFIDAAGTQAAAKRLRTRELIRFAADFYRDCLLYRCGQVSPSRTDDADRQEALCRRVDETALLDLIDRCLDADFHIGRFLSQTLAVECWIDDLAQLTAGSYVASISFAG